MGGFIDDSITSLPGGHPGPVVGSITGYTPRSDDLLVTGIGSPAGRRKCAELLREKGARFANFIHPTALIGRNVVLGEGVVLLAHVNLTCDIRVGDFTVFLSLSGAGHDAQIGSYCQVSSGCDLMGGVVLGDEVMLGSGARILPRVKVGHRAVIGTGSVVLSRVADDETVFGSPARRLVLRADRSKS
jgi:sugar O-acyltransferase (sialic acid O-acetyltransferase NeuD family)